MRSSSSDHTLVLSTPGCRWLHQRSRACFPSRSGSRSATAVQLRVPSSSTAAVRIASSSGVHAPRLMPARSTFSQRCCSCVRVRCGDVKCSATSPQRLHPYSATSCFRRSSSHGAQFSFADVRGGLLSADVITTRGSAATWRVGEARRRKKSQDGAHGEAGENLERAAPHSQKTSSPSSSPKE